MYVVTDMQDKSTIYFAHVFLVLVVLTLFMTIQKKVNAKDNVREIMIELALHQRGTFPKKVCNKERKREE